MAGTVKQLKTVLEKIIELYKHLCGEKTRPTYLCKLPIKTKFPPMPPVKQPKPESDVNPKQSNSEDSCKNCGYKIHSERISNLNNCNDCGKQNNCTMLPRLGQDCRINCYDFAPIKKDQIQDLKNLIGEMAEYICDHKCGVLHSGLSQGVVAGICRACNLNDFIKHIENWYTNKAEMVDKLYLEKCQEVNRLQEKLRYYENLSEHGKLIELPCEMKLGQKWFYIGFDEPIEFEIVDFGWWNTDGLGAYGLGNFPNMTKLFFPFTYFGKYVFKTYDKAEQALAERQ